jgi:hypothetical protein
MWHQDFDFYVHIDKKLDIKTYKFIQKIPNVYFIKERKDIKWESFNSVIAIFSWVKEIVGSGIRYQFINTLSGEDYPLKTADELRTFFLKNKGQEFLTCWDLKNDLKDGSRRVEKYYFTDLNFWGKNWFEKLLNIVRPPRKIPYNLHPYGNSMFWMLSPDAAMYVIQRIQNDIKLIQFFSLCWGSAEFVFQTILLNSPYKDNIVNNNYRFNDQSQELLSSVAMDAANYNSFNKSNMLFASR